jgi:hypothetical protein
VVFALYHGQAKVRIQAGMRTCLEKGVDPAVWAASYKLGTKSPSIMGDPQAVAEAAISKMSAEERKALLERMMAGLDD